MGIWAAWDDCYQISLVNVHLRFLLLQVVDERGYAWLLLLLYGHPHVLFREETWKVVDKALEGWSLPWLVWGDFNQVLDGKEKWCRGNGSISGAVWLKDFVNKFHLRGIESYGVFYTWTNNRKGDNATFEKLDRAMGSVEWCRRFPKAAVLVLPIHRSDHSPLVLDTDWVEVKRARLKRFEEMWLQCEEVSQITRKAWDVQVAGSTTFRLVQEQKMLLRHLCN